MRSLELLMRCCLFSRPLFVPFGKLKKDKEQTLLIENASERATDSKILIQPQVAEMGTLMSLECEAAIIHLVTRCDALRKNLGRS